MQHIYTQTLLQCMYPEGGGPGRSDILIVIDESPSMINYIIKCGGRIKPFTKTVQGYHVPITLKNVIRLSQVSDHNAGCSDLDYNAHQSLVDSYVERLNRGYGSHKIYLEEALNIKVDMSHVKDLCEGFTPVVIQGTMACGLSFPEPTKAVITSGNCI